MNNPALSCTSQKLVSRFLQESHVSLDIAKIDISFYVMRNDILPFGKFRIISENACDLNML